MRKKSISLLNYEGDVFKLTKSLIPNKFDIIDYRNVMIKRYITSDEVMKIYDGHEVIQTSNGRLYNLSTEHPNAKPSRESILEFISYKEIPKREYKTKIETQMPKSKQLADLGFVYIPELKEYTTEIGHITVTLKENGTLGLFDGDYMEIGEVSNKQLKTFIQTLESIIGKIAKSNM